jgi:hypothetical protein
MGEEDPVKLLDTFTVDELREACGRGNLGLAIARKSELIAAMLQVAPPEVAGSVVLPVLEPTRDAVISVIRDIRVPRRKTDYEANAQAHIEAVVKPRFAMARGQYSVGGYLGQKIDLDVGNGRVGVEIKLATALLKSNEAQRLIGQLVYYAKKRYGTNLVAVVVGTQRDLDDSHLAELGAFIQSLGFACVFVEAS